MPDNSAIAHAASLFPLEAIAAEDESALAKTAQQAMDDPLIMRQLIKRVHHLMQEDLRVRQERQRGYGRRRNAI